MVGGEVTMIPQGCFFTEKTPAPWPPIRYSGRSTPMPRDRLVVVAVVARAVAAYTEHPWDCQRDEPRTGGVRNSGYFFSPQTYHLHAPRRRVSELAWAPIRIHTHVISLDGLTPEQQTQLTDEVLPFAVG